LSFQSNTKITFYGGINEIGGNKFLIEDKGVKIFLDFGMQMGKFTDYYSHFLMPRTSNLMMDLFEFELLPPLKGLYRQDYTKHIGYGGDEETDFDCVLLTHAHVDHAAYIHYLRPEIPIYCSEPTKLIMQALQDTGSNDDYVQYEENFQTYINKSGELSRKRGQDTKRPRNIKLFEDYKKFKVGSVEIEPIPIDHSLPGVTGFIIHTSNGSIGYTGDIRFHGRRTDTSEKFIEKCSQSAIDILLCEGTRINEEFSKTEIDVEKDAKDIINATKELVVCTYPARDLDRLLSFYNATKETNRDLVIDLKQAYLLKLFQTSEKWKSVYPKPDDKNIKIYLSKKGWGLIDKDIHNKWTKKQLLADYDNWADEFIDYSNSIYHRHVKEHQKDFVFFCSDFQLQELIDIRPNANSSYIRSSTEPFNEEMELEMVRVKRWLVHFGLLQNDENWKQIHVSGHGSGDQLRNIIQNSNSKQVIPIHTEHEEYYNQWHNNVQNVELKKSIYM